ncbi:MAG: xanthine dehydrogenase family protein molybdopterin-binding subunit [Deltaproteobacteria bacterium]|nr:xanthine dehydrogenase family protein molybdopterin-binding subunit [Deltaproteobacteria bacterium]
MSRVIRIRRWGILKTIFSAGALILSARASFRKASDGTAGEAEWRPGVYLGIEPTGTVIIVAHRSEMGTGIRTALPMVVADELDADWKRVRIEQAIGDAKYGSQDTDGSRSIRDFYDVMRRAGATARLMLERAAAAKWAVPVEECRASNHRIVHLSGDRSLDYGELAESAAGLPAPKTEELRFKTPGEFRYIGKGVPIVDITEICTGKAEYGIDAHLPGMVFASIERPPALGGKLKSYEDRETLKIPGVRRTIVIEEAKPPYAFKALGGVAVIADRTWAAIEGRKKLTVEWEPGPNAGYDSEAYRESLLETARNPQRVIRNIGDVEAEFSRAERIHEAEYYVPLLAHAPMEPPAAVAAYKDGKVEVRAATQNPQAVQNAVAAALKITKEDVTCHVTLLGGGFGRKSKPDYVVEAAMLSKQVGKPVQVTWTREDDIRFDYYNAVAGMYLKAALGHNGKPTAWLQRSVFPPIMSLFDENEGYGDPMHLGQGLTDLPFDIPNLRVENGPAKAHVRIGWLRSVANIYHAFSVQSFIDELAAAADRDRVDYFLEVLGRPRTIDFEAENTTYVNYGKPLDQYPWETGRLRNVIEVAAEKSGWAKRKPEEGRSLGFAAHRSFLTYVAAVVDVRLDDQGRISIPRVDFAVDAGRVVHPELTRAQFEGAAVFATSIALMGEITAANGQIRQSNYDDYPVARINEAPFETHVHLVPSNGLPAGIGEPGVPPIAPAICNALFAITGKRIRRLPIKHGKLI